MYKKSRYIFTQSLAPLIGNESERVSAAIVKIQEVVPVSLSNWDAQIVNQRTSYIIDKFLHSIGVEDMS